MVPTKLRYKGVVRNVLIFAGGYDESNDIDYSVGQTPKEEDSSGNMIYIVDAGTGELVYSLGKPGSGATQDDFDAMKYSIPSDIRVLDIDGNGFGDSLFVGDLGGQVWRFDFNLYHSAGDGDLVQGGVMAALSGAKTNLSQNRRFFYEPDVALVRDNGERFLSIAIGSGWRSHPLNTKVKDRFYVLRSNDVYNMPDGYGKETDTDTWEPLKESDLTDVTSDVNATINGYGWMLRLERTGEKVLGDAITVNSKVVFSTFLPEASVGDCSPALGGGAVYAMRVSNGSAAIDFDDDGDADEEDRSTKLNHAGIPPEATALIVEGADGKIKPTILVGPEQPLEDKGLFSENLTKRTFWIDAGMKRHGAKAENADAPEQQDSSTADASGANGG